MDNRTIQFLFSVDKLTHHCVGVLLISIGNPPAAKSRCVPFHLPFVKKNDR